MRNAERVGLLAGIALLLLAPAAARGQTEAVEVDPIRCWWRTSAGGVRLGEILSVGLTCAVLENDSVQVQPDETRLGPAVIQMAPFEIVGGEHPSDLHTANRRFFQYEYRLRLINPDAIGKDVKIPDLVLHYRINSKVSGNAALQGRDHTYLLPPLSVRIVSLVPADAPDIRDTAGEAFSEAERFTFRAGVFDIVAYTLIALGSLMVVLSAVRFVARRSRVPVGKHRIREGSVLGAAGR